jgi:hypothetical protein
VRLALISSYCCAALLWLTTLVAGADDVQKSSTTTVKNGRTVTVETYTRNGATNLVAKTTSWRDGKGIQRTLMIQQVYRTNVLALEIWSADNGITLSAKAGSDVDVGTHFTPRGELDNVNLMTKDSVTIDHFAVSNGVLRPASTSLIEKANAVTKDMKGLFDSENVRTNSADEFGRPAQ